MCRAYNLRHSRRVATVKVMSRPISTSSTRSQRGPALISSVVPNHSISPLIVSTSHTDTMASQAPLLSGTIEADDDAPAIAKGNIGAPKAQREPELLVPGTQAASSRAGNSGAAEEGGIVRRSRGPG
jgi:hypothetical protein